MFDKLFDFFDMIVVGNIASMVGKFTTVITPLLGACVMLYLIYLCWQAMFDTQNMMIPEALKTIGALSAVTFIALDTEYYLNNIVPIVLESGDDISRALLDTSVGGSGSIQRIFDIMTDRIKFMWEQVDMDIFTGESVSNSALLLLQIFICLCGFIPFIAVATCHLIMAKIMVSFLLIIGPLFIMCAFFPSMRNFFQAWTGQCFNYILLSVLYPLAFTIFTEALNVVVFNNSLSIESAIMTAITFMVLVMLSVHIPTLSSSLSGGVGINGLAGSAMGALTGMAAAGGGILAIAKAVKKAPNVAKDLMKGKIQAG